MPSPSQIRDLRIRRLVSVAENLVEGGSSPYNLAGKLRVLARRSWPGVCESTIKSYVSSAITEILSRPHTESVLPEMVSPGEAK